MDRYIIRDQGDTFLAIEGETDLRYILSTNSINDSTLL